MRQILCSVVLCGVLVFSLGRATAGEGKLVLEPIPEARFQFGGVIGERVEANVENWLIRAPYANPGMIEMFRVRDRKPQPQIVPWAGEFVGKYLISAIQADRMVVDDRVTKTIQDVIDNLIDTQAEDGYLGPFRKEERLLGHWDLWGHYHILQALLMWNERTGDQRSLDAAIRAADLICQVYLDGDRRPKDAGSDEMNLSVIHGMGLLHRKTGNPRYFDMMKVIEKDWESTGDYYRQGLAGVDFYRIPRPRWESLHCLQGLKELYLITGDETYRTAFLNLWDSIRRLDRHNTGGFSTGEAAIGNPYSPGAIETCCTTAWSALTLDALALMGDPNAAEELELSLYNSILGSQHPTGRWWTYDTPMNGKREASAHTIVFQSRAGTPELNCCSVNAPRGLGMLSEWAVMRDEEGGVVVNFLGEMSAEIPQADGTTIQLDQHSSYPIGERVHLKLTMDGTAELTIKVRIPSWAEGSVAAVNGQAINAVKPGEFVEIRRVWKSGDTVLLNIKLPTRTWVGDGAAAGKVSIYRGPILLAFDQRHNPFDRDGIPELDFKDLESSPVWIGEDRFPPMTLREFQGAEGVPLRLCDFATAGALGTEYVSWLPVRDAPPPPFHAESPKNGAILPDGPNLFVWTGPRVAEDKTYRFILSANEDLSDPVVDEEGLTRTQRVVREALDPDRPYYWRVIAVNKHGESEMEGRVHSFRINPSLESTFIDHPALFDFRSDGLVAGSYLNGNADPVYGYLEKAEGIQPATGHEGEPGAAIAFTGDGMIRYRIPHFPLDDYTFAAWVKPEKQVHGLGQIFSAWAKGGDDPLRVVIDGGKIHARIEGQGNFSTAGVPLEMGGWVHVVAVKEGGALRLYLDGVKASETGIPVMGRHTSALDFALGANPHHTGPEFFRGAIDNFAFYARALSGEEIGTLFRDGLDLEPK